MNDSYDFQLIFFHVFVLLLKFGTKLSGFGSVAAKSVNVYHWVVDFLRIELISYDLSLYMKMGKCATCTCWQSKG